jgi:type I restriction enzyme R subunit
VNEAEIRAELIDPALKAAGWGVIEGSRIRREVIAPRRLIGNGKRAQADIADYVLVYRGEKLAALNELKCDYNHNFAAPGSITLPLTTL